MGGELRGWVLGPSRRGKLEDMYIFIITKSPCLDIKLD